MKDFLGRTIKVGDFLVYGRRDGDSFKTSLYEVTEVTSKAVKAKSLMSTGYGGYSDDRRWAKGSSITNPQRTVVVPREDALKLLEEEGNL